MTETKNGIYTVDYYHGRQNHRQLIYRLKRRTLEVKNAIHRFSDRPDNTILDIGSADALMLNMLQKHFSTSKFVGLEYNLGLLSATDIKHICKIQGDGLCLPIKSGSIDIAIAAAFIEHIADSNKFFNEIERILRCDGLIIMTTPNPAMDWIAGKVGILKDSGHQNSYTLKKLTLEIEKYGFHVLKTKKFMFSPIGFPAERTIEKVLGPLGLNLIMANQLLVATRVQNCNTH